ncbi:MAG: S8 family serine peptidase [bacterium]
MKYLLLLFSIFIFSGLNAAVDDFACYYVNGERNCLEFEKNKIALNTGPERSVNNLSNIVSGIKFIESRGKIDIYGMDEVFSEADFKALIERNYSVWPVFSSAAGVLLPTDGRIGFFVKDSSDIKKIVSSHELRLIKNYENHENMITALVPEGSNPFRVADKIKKTGLVSWAQPIWYEPVKLRSWQPDDEFYPQQWHHKNINSELAWSIATGNEKAAIAVIDSGVDTAHPDLLLRIGRSFVPTEQAVEPNMGMFQNNYMMAHGTCVSGLAAAKGNNSIGVAGVCPECSVIPIKYIGNEMAHPPLDRKFEAISWAVDNGAWVINNSWSAASDTDNAGNCVEIPPDNFMEQAIEYAITEGRDGLGTVLVWSSGNSTCDTQLNKTLHSDDIIVVSATREDDSITDYSNYGSHIDVAAPAGNAGEKKNGLVTTDVSQPGKGFNPYYPNAGGPEYTDLPDESYTKYFDGTSASAPLVSGAIALMLSVRPGMSYAEAIACTEEAAALPEGSDCPHGNIGQCYGHGILNVENMLKMATSGDCGGEGCSDDSQCGENEHCNLDTGICEKSEEDSQHDGDGAEEDTSEDNNEGQNDDDSGDATDSENGSSEDSEGTESDSETSPDDEDAHDENLENTENKENSSDTPEDEEAGCSTLYI